MFISIFAITTLEPVYTFTLRFDQLKELLDFIVEMVNDLSKYSVDVDTFEIANDNGAEKTYNIVMDNI